MSKLVVYKANALIEARYKLTLIEHRILLYAISKMNPLTPVFGAEFPDIHVDDFLSEFPDMSPKNAYSQIKKGIDKLSERWIVIKNDDTKTKMRWVLGVRYYEHRGMFTLMMNDLIIPYLLNLKEQFTKYHLQNICGLKHIYSIRLYEILIQFKKFGVRKLKLSELRKMLQIEFKYLRYDTFKQKVITPALDELNLKSDLNIELFEGKQGRSISELTFKFKLKESVFRERTLRELNALRKNLKN